MPFSGDPGVAPRGEEHRISACLSHVAAAGAARGAKGNGEAQEAIRGNKLSEAAMHAPGEERRDPKNQQPPEKKQLSTHKQKQSNLHSHIRSFNSTQMHHHHHNSASPSIPCKIKSKSKNKIQHAPQRLFSLPLPLLPLSSSVQPGNIPTKHSPLFTTTTTTSHPNSHTPQQNNCNNSLPPTHPPSATHSLSTTIYSTHSPQIHQLQKHSYKSPQHSSFHLPRQSKG